MSFLIWREVSQESSRIKARALNESRSIKYNILHIACSDQKRLTLGALSNVRNARTPKVILHPRPPSLSKMGKGSNVSKANKSREKNAEKLAAQGKGGGGKEGMKERKPDNVAEVMKKEQEERERLKREKEEREKLKKEEDEKKQKKLAEAAAKAEAEAAAAKAAKKV